MRKLFCDGCDREIVAKYLRLILGDGTKVDLHISCAELDFSSRISNLTLGVEIIYRVQTVGK